MPKRTRLAFPEHFDETWFSPGALETEAGFATIYGELRAIARYLLRGEAYRPTLQATELVNEAFAKLYRSPIALNDRQHALAILGRYMRQILIDRARRRGAVKRSGERVTLDDRSHGLDFDLSQWQILRDALAALDESQPRLARVFELRYFMGLTHAEIAEFLDCSERTTKRSWQAARAWLQEALESAQGAS